MTTLSESLVPPPDSTLRADHALLVEAVRQAGAIALGHFRHEPEEWEKSPGNLVSEADLASEVCLFQHLCRARPDYGWLSEESEDDIARLSAGRVWVVDPIDGTSNFSRGLPHFAVSVALLFRGQPMLAAIHCAPDGGLFTAVHGTGCWRNNRRITAPAGRFDDGAIVGCQWFRGQKEMKFLPQLQSQGARIRTLGSTVTQLADVVMGRLDGNVQQQGRLWDFAAAGLVAVEAGVKFTDWHGRAVFPVKNLLIEHTATIAATPAVHRRIAKLLRPYAG